MGPATGSDHIRTGLAPHDFELAWTSSETKNGRVKSLIILKFSSSLRLNAARPWVVIDFHAASGFSMGMGVDS